ncbi:MAG: hypothetical protein NTV86_19715, partial [Planctomycetota bacterium]|nr:hypothetical protein [Planctomycetota bacterium]
MRRDGLWIRGLAAMAVLACAAAWGQEAGPPASQPGIQVDRKEGVPETVLKKIGERATGKTQEDLDAQKRALEARQRASAEEAVRRAEEKLTRAEEQQHARKLQEALRGKAAGAAGEGAERASGGKGGVEQAKAEVAERKSDVKTMDADAARTARNERIAKGVSWAGRTLAVYDAYQEEKAAAKKEHRTFSQANLTLNVAMNLSGITGAVGAFRATTRASDDMLKENLKRYAAAGYDINDPRVQAKAAMRAIAYGTVIGTYNGAKCLPVLGD